MKSNFLRSMKNFSPFPGSSSNNILRILSLCGTVSRLMAEGNGKLTYSIVNKFLNAQNEASEIILTTFPEVSKMKAKSISRRMLCLYMDYNLSFLTDSQRIWFSKKEILSSRRALGDFSNDEAFAVASMVLAKSGCPDEENFTIMKELSETCKRHAENYKRLSPHEKFSAMEIHNIFITNCAKFYYLLPEAERIAKLENFFVKDIPNFQVEEGNSLKRFELAQQHGNDACPC